MNPNIQSQLQKTALNDQNRQREQVKTLVEKIEAEGFENKAGVLNNFTDWDELKMLIGAKERPAPKKEPVPPPEEKSPDDPGATEKTQSEGSGDATPKKKTSDVKPTTGKKASAVKSPGAKVKAASKGTKGKK